MVAAYGMPSSMWVAWFSPSVRRSRMTAHEASLEIVDSMPCFLKSPSSCAMTIDEQSVSAMMPMRILGVSGASEAHAPPLHRAGTPASSAVATDAPRNSRRLSRIRSPPPENRKGAVPRLQASAPLCVRRLSQPRAAGAEVHRLCHVPAAERARRASTAKPTYATRIVERRAAGCRVSKQPGAGCRFSWQQLERRDLAATLSSGYPRAASKEDGHVQH